MNLSVISRYALRDRRTKSFKEILNFVIIPVLGFISIAALWIETDETSLKAGLTWAAVGVFYLAYKTGGFTRPAPQYNEFDDHK